MAADTMTLTEFLLARIAETEAAARALGDPDWKPASFIEEALPEEIAYSPHVTPARVLAECEAKRRIVEALVDAENAVAGYDNDKPDQPPSYWQEWGNCHALRLAAEAIALPYVDHPDYREEWRP